MISRNSLALSGNARNIHRLGVAETLASFGTAETGLTSAEAARRLAEFGPNRIESGRKRRLAARLMSEFTHFFAVILWFATALALFADWQAPGQGMGVLAAAIVGVIAVNGLFSFWQSHRSEAAIRSLDALLPHRIKAMRDGRIIELDADAIVAGDVIVIGQGERIPADCRYLQGFAAQANLATITGESAPVALASAPSAAADITASRNILFAGTSLVAGEAHAVVFATGSHTMLGRIARFTRSATDELTPLQIEVARLSRTIARIALAIGALFYGLGLWLDLGFWQNLLFAIGIIVANVPEGLLPTVTLSLAIGAQRMARRNMLVRSLPAVEGLGGVTVICTDKTGTLTENRMAARQAWLCGRLYDMSGLAAAAGPGATASRLIRAALQCHTAKDVQIDGRQTLVGDPMEVALVTMARRSFPHTPIADVIDEVPFDSDRKRLSVVSREQDGLCVYTKGALETVLPLCDRIALDSGSVELDDRWRAAIQADHDRIAETGARLVLFAMRRIGPKYDSQTLETHLDLLGFIALDDPPRSEVPAAIAACKEAGIRVIMITGDHPRTALAIAREIGLAGPAPLIVSGEELSRLSMIQLQLALDAPEIIFARVGPEHKLKIVSALQAKGDVVAVTGDGVNDAPALRQADIGIAMGQTGTDVAREAADMILVDDNFASVVTAIEEGRTVYANIRKFLTYILTSNVPEIVPFLAFAMLCIPLPLTVIQILAVDLGTDIIPALALGAERPNPDTMRRRPRKKEERLLDWHMAFRAFLFLGVVEATAAMSVFFLVLDDAGWRYGEPVAPTAPLYLTATAACLATIVVMQVANLFLCRSESKSAFSKSIKDNWLLSVGLAAEIVLILAIIYTDLGNLLFGTAALPGWVWSSAMLFALAMVAIEECRKWVVRRATSR